MLQKKTNIHILVIQYEELEISYQLGYLYTLIT